MAAFPPRMSDGRIFTQYTPACEARPASVSSNQARRAMTKNGAAIIDANRQMAETMDGFHHMAVCFDTTTSGTVLPEEQRLVCDERRCDMMPYVPGGLGLRTQGVVRRTP